MRRSRILLVASLLLVAPVACTTSPDDAAAPPAQDVRLDLAAAAVVGGVEISEEDLERRLATVTSDPDVEAALAAEPGLLTQLTADVAGQMVEAQLIAQHAPDVGVTTTEADLQAYVDEIVAGYLGGGPDAWQAFLDEKGYPEVEVRAQLMEDLRREQLKDVIAPDVVVDPAAVEAAYQQGYAGRPMVAHILVADLADAQQIVADLGAGADFGELAREQSIDSASAAQGGELGPWAKGDFTASVDEALERGRDGQVLGPVPSPFGWHVVRRSPPAPLDAVRDQIASRLVEAEQNAQVTAWVAGLRADADVEVRPDVGVWDPATGRVDLPVADALEEDS